jgi:pimeloyl-ACP methyl ester carboxylesterase
MHPYVSEDSERYSECFLSTCGLSIRFMTAGDGDVVLLLHGWGGSLDSMRPVYDDLIRHHRVYALDLPGHGRSGIPSSAWGVTEYTNCVVEFLQQAGIDTATIIGHSFGGRIAIKLAVFFPQLVNKIVFIDSAGVRPPRGARYYLRFSVAKIGKFASRYFGTLGRAVKSWLYARIASADYARAGELRETFVKVVTEDLTPLLARIRQPSLILWGENDLDTPLVMGQTMARMIPNARLVILPDAGHFSYLDQFAKFRLHVARFLGGTNCQ